MRYTLKIIKININFSIKRIKISNNNRPLLALCSNINLHYCTMGTIKSFILHSWWLSSCNPVDDLGLTNGLCTAWETQYFISHHFLNLLGFFIDIFVLGWKCRVLYWWICLGTCKLPLLSDFKIAPEHCIVLLFKKKHSTLSRSCTNNKWWILFE